MVKVPVEGEAVAVNEDILLHIIGDAGKAEQPTAELNIINWVQSPAHRSIVKLMTVGMGRRCSNF